MFSFWSTELGKCLWLDIRVQSDGPGDVLSVQLAWCVWQMLAYSWQTDYVAFTLCLKNLMHIFGIFEVMWFLLESW